MKNTYPCAGVADKGKGRRKTVKEENNSIRFNLVKRVNKEFTRFGLQQWSLFREQALLCPEFASFYSLHANEVGFETGFQAVLNLLHFKLTCQWSRFWDRLQTALNLPHLAVYAINEGILRDGISNRPEIASPYAYASMKYITGSDFTLSWICSTSQ